MMLPLALLMLSLAGPGGPPAISLDALRARQDQYRGQTVRVAGQVDECWNMSCHLCPIEATPAAPLSPRCLAIDFDRFRGGPRGIGADMAGAFRYADVVVAARFDPTCLEGLCTDRATVLRDARVETVTRRRRSRDGLIARPDPLVAAAGPYMAPLLALATRGDSEAAARTRVFASRSDPRLEHSAVVCRSSSGPGEDAEWPTTWQGAITARSTEDRFRCRMVRRYDDGWAIGPD